MFKGFLLALRNVTVRIQDVQHELLVFIIFGLLPLHALALFPAMSA